MTDYINIIIRHTEYCDLFAGGTHVTRNHSFGPDKRHEISWGFICFLAMELKEKEKIDRLVILLLLLKDTKEDYNTNSDAVILIVLLLPSSSSLSVLVVVAAVDGI